jgi:hypothetical protein
MNVGGHRTFRPRVLAHELRRYDVVSVGATGTFVARRPGRSNAAFLAALLRKLPVKTHAVLCDARDIIRLEKKHPFGAIRSQRDVVRFVSVLPKAGAVRVPLPVSLPPVGPWLVRIIASDGRFVFGTYRRRMRTIAYLGKIDALFGAPATTRNWNTIEAVVRILKDVSAP